MPLTRAHFLVTEGSLFVLSLMCGYHTPRSMRWIYAFLQAVHFGVVLWFIPVSNFAADYVFACISAFSTLRAIDFFILTPDIYTTLHELSYPTYARLSSTAARFRWALGLFSASRGTGWNWQVPYLLPPPPKGSLWRTAVQRLVAAYLSYDLAMTALQSTTLNDDNAWWRTAGAQGRGLWDLPLPQKVWQFWLYAASLVANVEASLWLLDSLFVACGMRPENVRPICGNWRECWSVGQFWGRCWHQTLRRVLQTHGRFLAWRVLRARRGSLLSNYTQAFTAFFLCGIGHWVGNYTADPSRGWGRTLFFFFVQPFAIMAERGVMALGRRVGVRGDKAWVRWVGRLWVMVWMMYTASGMIDDCIRLNARPRGAFTVVGGLTRGVWTTK